MNICFLTGKRCNFFCHQLTFSVEFLILDQGFLKVTLQVEDIPGLECLIDRYLGKSRSRKANSSDERVRACSWRTPLYKSD